MLMIQTICCSLRCTGQQKRKNTYYSEVLVQCLANKTIMIHEPVYH